MRTLVYFLALIIVPFGCTHSKEESKIDPKNYDSIELKYAEFFRLKQKGNEFLLELLDPDSKKVVQTVEISNKKNERITSLVSPLKINFTTKN